MQELFSDIQMFIVQQLTQILRAKTFLNYVHLMFFHRYVIARIIKTISLWNDILRGTVQPLTVEPIDHVGCNKGKTESMLSSTNQTATQGTDYCVSCSNNSIMSRSIV